MIRTRLLKLGFDAADCARRRFNSDNDSDGATTDMMTSIDGATSTGSVASAAHCLGRATQPNGTHWRPGLGVAPAILGLAHICSLHGHVLPCSSHPRVLPSPRFHAVEFYRPVTSVGCISSLPQRTTPNSHLGHHAYATIHRDAYENLKIKMKRPNTSWAIKTLVATSTRHTTRQGVNHERDTGDRRPRGNVGKACHKRRKHSRSLFNCNNPVVVASRRFDSLAIHLPRSSSFSG
jgi:hypothetical protein